MVVEVEGVATGADGDAWTAGFCVAVTPTGTGALEVGACAGILGPKTKSPDVADRGAGQDGQDEQPIPILSVRIFELVL